VRIGQGFDIHPLVPGRKLMIGGYEVPSEFGEDGHSDGDVLLHAIIDALLGASALGDIGSHFPPSDSKYKDIDSKALLKETIGIVKHKPINLDCTVILETPKLRPHIDAIRKELSSLLGLPLDAVSVKAKTAEHMLCELGRSEAIVAEAVVLCE